MKVLYPDLYGPYGTTSTAREVFFSPVASVAKASE